MPLPTKADEMFCFAVYSASHMINRAYAPMLKDLGLTYPQYITLTMLWEQDAQTVGALSKRLNMDSNTLTPLLKRLEKLGHLTRARDPKDERRVIVRLTRSGRALQNHAPEIVRCMVEATGMTPAELDELVNTLGALSAALRTEPP